MLEVYGFCNNHEQAMRFIPSQFDNFADLVYTLRTLAAFKRRKEARRLAKQCAELMETCDDECFAGMALPGFPEDISLIRKQFAFGASPGGRAKTAHKLESRVPTSKYRQTKPPKEIRNCTVRFKCPKLWRMLTETEDPKIRFCEQCAKQVYLVETEAELGMHSSAGRCVAILNLSRQHKDYGKETLMGDIVLDFEPKDKKHRKRQN